MKTQTKILSSIFRLAVFVVAAACGSAAAETLGAKAAPPPSRILLAINEGGAANADATETLFKYQEFAEMIERTLRVQVVMVAVRDRDKLKGSLRKQEYPLLLARPNDVPAEAIRDFGYQPIAMAKEPSQTLFIVPKDSALMSIADVKGRTIVTPDAYSNMWRVANAMLRDANIIMANEKVRAMRDQAAIGWSIENKFFDVGVINSISGVGRTWEKNGGRVIARSRELPNMPFIASPQISEEQIAKLRAAVVALDNSDGGKAILKKIGINTGFQPASPRAFLDFLAWIGDLEAAKHAAQP